ncbi:MAG: YraN family protein [Verrucomicrobia bacterium]|nr:YraN family protein [Verrucomicrobiota bacterium]MCF7707524.1 YraN family protein [Verrucomicrobiota bacterium]
MSIVGLIKTFFEQKPAAPHLEVGCLGESAAKTYLRRRGMKFLTANFRSKRGEIDLVFRDGPALVLVEVKTRAPDSWSRPSAAVNAQKRRRITKVAFDYLRMIGHPRVPLRFDIVEVVVEAGEVLEIRHLPGAFHMTPPYRYG